MNQNGPKKRSLHFEQTKFKIFLNIKHNFLHNSNLHRQESTFWFNCTEQNDSSMFRKLIPTSWHQAMQQRSLNITHKPPPWPILFLSSHKAWKSCANRFFVSVVVCAWISFSLLEEIMFSLRFATFHLDYVTQFTEPLAFMLSNTKIHFKLFHSFLYHSIYLHTRIVSNKKSFRVFLLSPALLFFCY